MFKSSPESPEQSRSNLRVKAMEYIRRGKVAIAEAFSHAADRNMERAFDRLEDEVEEQSFLEDAIQRAWEAAEEERYQIWLEDHETTEQWAERVLYPQVEEQKSNWLAVEQYEKEQKAQDAIEEYEAASIDYWLAVEKRRTPLWKQFAMGDLTAEEYMDATLEQFIYEDVSARYWLAVERYRKIAVQEQIDYWLKVEEERENEEQDAFLDAMIASWDKNTIPLFNYRVEVDPWKLFASGMITLTEYLERTGDYSLFGSLDELLEHPEIVQPMNGPKGRYTTTFGGPVDPLEPEWESLDDPAIADALDNLAKWFVDPEGVASSTLDEVIPNESLTGYEGTVIDPLGREETILLGGHEFTIEPQGDDLGPDKVKDAIEAGRVAYEQEMDRWATPDWRERHSHKAVVDSTAKVPVRRVEQTHEPIWQQNEGGRTLIGFAPVVPTLALTGETYEEREALEGLGDPSPEESWNQAWERLFGSETQEEVEKEHKVLDALEKAMDEVDAADAADAQDRRENPWDYASRTVKEAVAADENRWSHLTQAWMLEPAEESVTEERLAEVVQPSYKDPIIAAMTAAEEEEYEGEKFVKYNKPEVMYPPNQGVIIPEGIYY